MIRVREDLSALAEYPLVSDDLSIQIGGSAVTSNNRFVQLSLRVRENLVGRSGFGPRTRHAGDAGLRTCRGGMVFAAGDDQSLVPMGARYVDSVVECDTRIAHPLQTGRCLYDNRSRGRVAGGLLLEVTVDWAGKYCK